MKQLLSTSITATCCLLNGWQLDCEPLLYSMSNAHLVLSTCKYLFQAQNFRTSQMSLQQESDELLAISKNIKNP